MAKKLGKDAALYWDTAGTAAVTSMTLLANIGDVTINETADKADSTGRDNAGYKSSMATLKDHNLAFQILYEPGDAAYAALRVAYTNGTLIAMAALTMAKGLPGAEGVLADYAITSFTQNQALNDIIKVDVVADISVFTDYVEIA